MHSEWIEHHDSPGVIKTWSRYFELQRFTLFPGDNIRQVKHASMISGRFLLPTMIQVVQGV